MFNFVAKQWNTQIDFVYCIQKHTCNFIDTNMSFFIKFVLVVYNKVQWANDKNCLIYRMQTIFCKISMCTNISA